mgnify:CR=1 FL=1|tara:strand:- start:7465 stop:8187 length:723 start_codon:yes stop_codon:yes gene_type:complete
MSLADVFGDYDFSNYLPEYDIGFGSASQTFSQPSNVYDVGFGSSSFMGTDDPFDQDEIDHFIDEFGENAKGNFELLQGGEYDPGDDEPGGFYGEIDNRSLAKQAQDFIFRNLGVGKETAEAISAFAKAANRGGGKERQAQGSGRTGPALPTSARAPTTAAGRTSRARQATSGERAIQAAISQSNRAQSAARAIANQMARAGTVTTTNDLADMISGATSPKGTKQALPGTRLRQLAIPRTA